ncbi:MAG TPA: AAA family ATPase [Gaiellaceae bacterium]|nr:AAA family ATPase [Gaiellaceae bacterium]
MSESNGSAPLRIYVTGSCEGLAEIVDALRIHGGIELVGLTEAVPEAASALTGGHLDAVIHATRGSEFPQDAYAAIREYTRAPVILLCSGDCSGILAEALEAEVADVIPLPQLTENIVFAIRKACQTEKRSGSAQSHMGKVTTVFSPKGGIGKTVVSTNLAATFAKYHKSRVLLLDLDLQFGDAAIMLGIEPEKTIYDLVVAPGELDTEKLAGYTTPHPCGLDVLPAPIRPEDAELVTEGKLARLLEVARASYDTIIVDTSPFFHGPMLATLDRTDLLLLLCGLDIPTIKNVRLGLQTLELLSYPPERIRVILNRANTNVGLKRSEVEETLRTKVHVELPSDRAVPMAVNRGKPVALAEPGSDFSKAIRDLADVIAARSSQKPPTKQKGEKKQKQPRQSILSKLKG